ncbi:hypothetical protein [Methylopila sp. M107]|uniref:hypothetical protein n=1 Tax=Methylopila sp. M107 TaxID=1101190 RepID=UPI0012DF27AD|nr:hypothetical protein [Methylopila sp. M107]
MQKTERDANLRRAWTRPIKKGRPHEANGPSLGRKRPRRAATQRSEDRHAALQKDAAALHKNQGQIPLIAGCDCLSHSPAIFFGLVFNTLNGVGAMLQTRIETRRDLLSVPEMSLG